MANIYCTATNTGKGFITTQDYISFFLSGHPGDVWVAEDTEKGALWVSRNSGTPKTTAEAQAIVDGKVEEDQATWDLLPEAEKAPTVGFETLTRPEKYILP